MASAITTGSIHELAGASPGTAVPFFGVPPVVERGHKPLYSCTLMVAVLLHVVAAVALTQLSPMRPKAAAPQSIQWVSVAMPVREAPRPELPAPELVPTEATLPLAPVIEIQSEAAITLASNVSVPVPTQAPSASGDVVKMVSVVEYVREPLAKYPPAARALKQRGVVTVRALIGVDGRAHEVHVHKSCGYKLLDDAARTAVLAALFKPYAENGRSQPVYVLIPIEFGVG